MLSFNTISLTIEISKCYCEIILKKRKPNKRSVMFKSGKNRISS